MGFPVHTKVRVRFSDTDAMGHCNNARFFSFMEEGRVVYTQNLYPEVNWSERWEEFPFILADIQCAFKSPAYCEETLVVALRAPTIGTKSFVFEYEIREEKTGRLVAVGKSVQVMYSYRTQSSLPIPEELRGKINRLEKRSA